MKLHIPLSLRAAILGAMTLTLALPTYAKDYNLGTSTTPNKHGLDTTKDVTIDSDDRVGYITDENLLYGDTDFGFNASLRTANITFDGGVIIDGGILSVGGAKGTDSPTFTKLTVKGNVTINSGKLLASTTNLGSLTVNGGVVEFHNGEGVANAPYGQGNSNLITTNKMSYVKGEVNVDGGELYAGYSGIGYMTGGTGTARNGNDSYHCLTGFGAGIKQTGGLVSVRNDTLISTGISQTGNKDSIMYITDNLALDSTTFNIDQSNDNAKMYIYRITCKYNTKSNYKANITQSKGSILLANGSFFRDSSTINILQKGGGTIEIGGGINSNDLKNIAKRTGGVDTSFGRNSGFISTNTTYNISQTKGEANLILKGVGKGNALNAVITAESINQSEGNTITIQQFAQLTATGDVTIGGTLSNAGTFTATKFILANGGTIATTSGTFTIGSGTAGDKGLLNVTSDGTFGAVLGGTAGAFTLGTGEGATAWTMAEGSTFSVGFTSDYLDTLTIDENNKLAFSNALVATVAGGGTATINDNLNYLLGDVGGTDASRWKLTDTTKLTKDATTGNVVLNGALEYNPWIEIKTGGTITETYSDTNADKKLYTGLAISEKDVELNADNTHSYGTRIDGVKVTLGAGDALGTGANVEEGHAAVETSGATTLATAEGITANLPGTITNTGALTMEGRYAATSDALGGTTSVEDAYFDLEGNKVTTTDGFLRAGSDGYLVVKNEGTDATLDPTDTTVTVGDTLYYLYETGYAGLNRIDYRTYYMNSADHEAVVSEIINASATLSGDEYIADKVVMNAGQLTVDGSIEVDFSGGEVIMKEGGDVTGTIEDTEVQAKGGAISADIIGTSSVTVTGNTTLSGDENSYTGGTLIDNATLKLGHENALGDGSVKTKGEAGLATVGDVVANLPKTITIEDGSLTMTGKYKAEADNLNNGKTITQDTEWFDVNGETGNGFMREGGEAHRVVDVSKGTLNVDALDDVTVTIDGIDYQLYSDGLAGAQLDYSTYYIKGEHEVAVSEILTANDTDTKTKTTKVEMKHADGSLTADAAMEVQATAGSLSVTNDAKVTGSLANTTITAEGGEIAAAISGNSSVKSTSGKTTLSGDNNTYTGGTTIDAAELIVTKDGGLGTGVVVLKNGGILDLSNKSIGNTIYVEGCTLRGGAAYKGDLITKSQLELDGDTSAKNVTLTENGSLTLDAANRLTILNGGGITLSDGCVLSVAGSLTLDGNTTLSLKDTYNVGTALVTGEAGLTMGSVTLDYADSTVELERIGNSLVLVSKFKQDKADAMAQGNWGIATASRAFVNTVRGQRNNTGCIANGKGTAWFSLLGASNNLKGGDVSVEGAAVGADTKVGKCSVMGVAFGYTDGKVSPTGLRKVQQDGYYAAVYGEHGLKKLSADSCLSLDWVAAYGTTESHQGELNWEQDSLQLNARVNWNKQLSDRLGVTAFAGVEYFANESDTAEGAKSGSIQNLRGELGVGVSYVAWGAPDTEPVTNEKGGLVSAGTAGCRKLVLHGELRYFNDLVRSNPVVEMSGIRGMGANPGRQGFGVEAGATYRINDRWSTSANYGFNAMEDSQEHRVNVGASYTF